MMNDNKLFFFWHTLASTAIARYSTALQISNVRWK